MSQKTVIVADGLFPEHEVPLGYLMNAGNIVCCDGSAEKLIKTGYKPSAIVGDMDSLNEETALLMADRIFRDDDQETNDLTKAVKWCYKEGLHDIVIVGATGKREDHTLGNISLLADYLKLVKVIMVTDTGLFMPFLTSCTINSFPGQQVSFFSLNSETAFTTRGLKYPLKNAKLRSWWMATLNESLSDTFSLSFEGGPVIVYLNYGV